MEPNFGGRSKENIELIKSMFLNNASLLHAVRNFFLQFEINDEEVAAINGLSQGQLRVLREEILPKAGRNSPIGGVSDSFVGFDFNQHPEVLNHQFLAREMCINYLEQQFRNLGTPKSIWNYALSLEKMTERPFKKSALELYLMLAARTMIISMVDKNLISLWMVANQKEVTPEQNKKNIIKNNSK